MAQDLYSAFGFYIIYLWGASGFRLYGVQEGFGYEVFVAWPGMSSESEYG